MISNDSPAAVPDVSVTPDRLRIVSRLYGLAAQLRLLLREIASDHGACITASLFVLFSLPTCLLLAVLVPPGEIADEPAHLLRADSLLYGEILGQRRATTYDGRPVIEAGLLANPTLFGVDMPPPVGHFAEKKLTPAKITELKARPWAKGAVWLPSPTTAIYMPIFYVPAAAAVGLAQAFDFSAYHAIWAARIANSLCFIAIGVCALLLATRGRILLFSVLSLPMTISLAASFNEDGLIIATSVLAFALLTRSAAPRGRAYWTAAILIAAVIMVKLPYFPLAFLLLVPCVRRGRYRPALQVGLRAAACAVVPGIIWTAVAMYFVATPFPLFPPYHAGYLWPGDHNTEFQSPNVAAQTEVFFHRPLYPIILPAKTIEASWLGLRNEMVGWFGWLEFGLPQRMYPFWVFAIACAIIGGLFEKPTPPRAPPPMAVIIGIVAVAAALCSIFDAEYLKWTRVGAPLIEGVQGRYLLPLLAACVVFIPVVRVSGGSRLKAVLAVPSFAMAALGMVVLPCLMISTYYLR